MNIKKVFVISILVFLIIFSLENSVFASSSGFVTKNGQKFYLNGKTFKSIGVNRYNLLTTGGTPYIGCGGRFNEIELDTWFSELEQMGITSVRFWLFQNFTKSGTDMKRFDYVLSLAKKYNVKVIPVFENQWNNCTQGGDKKSAWYAAGYLSPYGNYPLSLKDYIGKIIPLYKNNPQILMWQIMNEAESSNSDALLHFASDISSYIKSLDSNHLVSFGTIGTGQMSTRLYKGIHALNTIDVLEYHDYNAESQPLPAALGRRLKDSAALNKPLMIGESGITLSKYTPQQRANYLNNKINAYLKQNGSLYIIWSYREANPKESSYNFNNSDPLVPVIKKYTASF